MSFNNEDVTKLIVDTVKSAYDLGYNDGQVSKKTDKQSKFDPVDVSLLLAAIQPLVDIANAYDQNELDDDARKFWGKFNQHMNVEDPNNIELYAGRGGKRLLTLQDALNARDCVNMVMGKIND